MITYPNKVYLNGSFLDYQEAKISVFDRGFLFGDGVYEVMVQINGTRFYEKEHLKRLSRCLEKIQLNFKVKTLPEIVSKLLEVSGIYQSDCLIYIQVTRGVAPRTHHFPEKLIPTVMLYALPLKLPDINTMPYKIVLQEDHRWHRCDIKTISLSGSVLANDEAISKGNNEAIFYRNGLITEGSHSNIFFVKDGIIYTHPANEFILEGITRNIVIKLCMELNIPVRERAISKEEIPTMDEAFLTGTTTQIAFVRQVDEHFYYENTEPQSVTARLQQAYLKLKNDFKNDH